MRCGICGAELPARAGRGRPRKYCPGECANRAHQEGIKTWRSTGRYISSGIERPCVFCGVPQRRGKFCSVRCMERKKRGIDPAPTCRGCGKTLPIGTGRYCSHCPNVKVQHRGRRDVLRSQRLSVLNRDGWKCRLCGRTIDRSLKFPNRWSGSVDHILPVSLGGSDDPWNLQAAHLHCNISKHTTLPSDQLALPV